MNILVQTEDIVGATMAGPGIRYWELSRRLAERHPVTLATPGPPPSATPHPNLQVRSRPWRPAQSFYRDYDAVLTQRVLPRLAAAKRRYGFRLIVDLYDPVIIEALEQHAGLTPAAQSRLLYRLRGELELALASGDQFVCASEIQRDMWLGALTLAGRITPSAYGADPKLRELIDVVPFGIPEQPPERTGPGLRERFGIAGSDFVLLWGGGIWNWLDPVTLIESVADVCSRHPDTRLVFMGLQHPNARIKEMEKSFEAKRLAEALGLAERHVFFNQGWIPYEERQNFLLDADVGVSIHSEHLETHFAFRTRNLDYLWASLPVLATRGDFFADLLERSGAGVVVPAHDRDALTAAIIELLDPARRQRCSAAAATLREQYTWTRAARPLLRMLSNQAQVVRPGRRRLLGAFSQWYGAAALNRVLGQAPGRRG